jgi:hypothetical protein
VEKSFRGPAIRARLAEWLLAAADARRGRSRPEYDELEQQAARGS